MAGALIGALRVSLSAETTAFEAGMKRAQRQAATTSSSIQQSFNKTGAALKAGIAGFVSAVSLGALVAAGRAALDYAGSLGEVSQQLGVTTKDLQVFRYAAGQVGVGQEELETGLLKLTVTLGKVAAGAKAPTAALNAIGVSVDQLRGKDTGEAFRIIADGLEKIPDRAQRAAVEMALFGRSGAKLDNLLAGGSTAINELSLAAEKLGIVLSDKQIQNADATADKLDALKTVLAAQIAGVVADNANSILSFADSIAQLVGEMSRAIPKIQNFYRELKIAVLERQNALSSHFDGTIPFGLGAGNRAALRQRNNAKINALRGEAGAQRFGALFQGRPQTARAGGNIGQFLASGGGGGRKSGGGKSAEQLAKEAERKRLNALRDANQFDQQIRRAKMDVLRAEEQLADDGEERTQISLEIMDAERDAYQAQLQYEVAAGELSAVQADQLQIEYDKKDALERQKIAEEREAQRREDAAALNETDYRNQRAALEVQMQLADTMAERRDLALRMLDLDYRYERARLESIMAEEKIGSLRWEQARRDLAALDARQPAERQAAIEGTRGPMEEWQAQFSDIGEELEDLKVRGIMGAVDALGTLTEGWDSFRDAALNAIKQVIAELIRLQLMKLAANIIGGAAGGAGGGLGGFATAGFSFGMGAGSLPGIPGFATGGSFSVMGNHGIDKNMLSLNGLPIARVSHNERVSVGNDNNRASSAPPFVFNNYARMSAREARETGMQAAAGWSAEMAKARNRGYER